MTSPPERDLSKWVVPITVAAIAAVATLVAAVLPLLMDDSEKRPPGPGATGAAGSPEASSAGAASPTRPAPRDDPSNPASSAPVWADSSYILNVVAARGHDLDGELGADGGGDSIEDISLTKEAIEASGGTRLAVLDRTQVHSKDICRELIEQSGGTAVRASEVTTGSSVCYRTSGQRLGVLTLSRVRTVEERGAPAFRDVSFDYLTWAS
ncbi:hypothetical protein [Plantactinospora sp. GCM10030261]|uniref:hypothetical protein n=1 Tax=Plantactinospora sp. GCM10030261 TaxID=3273420 RepID=UPI00360EA1B4